MVGMVSRARMAPMVRRVGLACPRMRGASSSLATARTAKMGSMAPEGVAVEAGVAKVTLFVSLVT